MHFQSNKILDDPWLHNKETRILIIIIKCITLDIVRASINAVKYANNATNNAAHIFLANESFLHQV